MFLTKPKMDQMHIFIMQMLLAIGVIFGSQNFEINNKYDWALTIARYIVYILTVQGTKGLSVVVYDVFHNKRGLDVRLLQNINVLQIIMYVVSIAVLISNKQKFFAEDFPLIFIAYMIVEYPDIEAKTVTPTNYGVGMACNFYEGYLMNVIPSDGGKFGGFVQNINTFESREGVCVPVKKLFLIVTKTLYSPPDLQLFNKSNRDDLPKLEGCTRPIASEVAVHDVMFQSLDEVEKDMAGVRNRSYKNSAYKIYRPRGRPVCLVAECVTPLHTLNRVMENRELYEDLTAADVQDIINDFCNTLNKILSKSSECRDKVEMVFYDDTDPDSNLADVLLDRIRQLEPNFEDLISVKK